MLAAAPAGRTSPVRGDNGTHGSAAGHDSAGVRAVIVSMIVHGLWDFGLFTNTLSTPPGIGVVAFILADVVLAIVAVFTIRKIFPRHSSTSEAGAPTAG